MLEQIRVKVEIITPMFLSGADQTKAELRAASIKGLLRYWWRALQAESDIDALRRREAAIFGSGGDSESGSSSFSIRVIPETEAKPCREPFPQAASYLVQVEGKTYKTNVLVYLAYGTHDWIPKKGDVLNRDYFPIKSCFDIMLTFMKPIYKNEVLKALYTFSLFGGMGSRSRNGFGSFHIRNRDDVFGPVKEIFSVDHSYSNDNLGCLITQAGNAPYSSFCQGTMLFEDRAFFDTPLEALSEVGKIYRHARGRLEHRHQFEKRQYVGAPLDPPKETFTSILDRHAKPYFIKVAKAGNGYRSYILFLPSQYAAELEVDRNQRPIDHSKHNRMFREVCTEFNAILASKMEQII